MSVIIDRSSRRRPFSAWMKRLANLKSSSPDPTSNINLAAKSHPIKDKKTAEKNHPYPSSAHLYSNGRPGANGDSILESQGASNYSLTENGTSSIHSSKDGQAPPTRSTKSAAATISTNAGTMHSEAHAGSSGGGTNATVGGNLSAGGGNGSTFSSPAPSVQSLATTLTTIQSTGPSNLLGTSAAAQPGSFVPTHQNSSNTHGVQFSHQFPTSPPASAVPPHLQPPSTSTASGNPTTYSTATANNLLTDNASILTLASSSKRRRRHSLDTNASVRALAPSSIFGGSRESLPLSVLSSNIDSNPGPSTGGVHQTRPSGSGIPGGERASVYSASGIAPALTSERSSYYAGKAPAGGDGASMHSGFLGHSRNDSITGSLGATPGTGTGSPLASPKEVLGGNQNHPGSTAAGNTLPVGVGKTSRRSSGWQDVGEDVDGEEKDEDDVGSSSKGKGKARAIE